LVEITREVANLWFLNFLTCRKDLRKLAGVRRRKWFHLPTTDVTLHGPRAVLKRALFRLARRLPGLREVSGYDDQSKFSLHG
jgi:hypothetical protein